MNKFSANWYRPIFLVFKSVGDIGPLLLREARLLLVQDVLRGFLCPTAGFRCPPSATGWPLLCCSSCERAPGETKGSVEVSSKTPAQVKCALGLLDNTDITNSNIHYSTYPIYVMIITAEMLIHRHL